VTQREFILHLNPEEKNMSLKKMSVVLGVLLIASMVLTACPAPAPQVVEKVVTQVVDK
jgi:hypothetical protein